MANGMYNHDWMNMMARDRSETMLRDRYPYLADVVCTSHFKAWLEDSHEAIQRLAKSAHPADAEELLAIYRHENPRQWSEALDRFHRRGGGVRGVSWVGLMDEYGIGVRVQKKAPVKAAGNRRKLVLVL